MARWTTAMFSRRACFMAVLVLAPAALVAACSEGRSERLDCEQSLECPMGMLCNESRECEAVTIAGVAVQGAAEGAPGEVSVLTADGTVCPASRCEALPLGSRVTLRAPEAAGHRFLGWTGAPACMGSARDLIIESLASDTRCVARYARRVRVSALDPSGEGGINVASSAPSASCSGLACEVDLGSRVVISAAARASARFAGWSGTGCESSEPTLNLSAVRDLVCTARYVQRFTVSGSADGVAGPTASSEGEGSRCEQGACSVDRGATVTLAAPVVAGQRFAGWSGTPACTGAEPTLRIPDVSADQACRAGYVERRTVRATSMGAEPPPAMQVQSSDAHARCEGSSCEIDRGGSVTLVAPSSPGFRLTGWSGPACEGQVAAAVSLRAVESDLECIAQYVRGISVAGALLGADGEVTASSTTPFAQCMGGSCAIDVGGNATLSAPTLADRRFVGWEGESGCSGDRPSISFENVTTSKTCYARYATRLTVRGSALPSGAGSVRASSDSAAASCADESCTLDLGGEVTLSASSASDEFRFSGWSGGSACVASGPTLRLGELSENLTCSANFVGRVAVVGSVEPMAGGSVVASSSTPFAACMGASCSVDVGARVALTASAAPGYRFTGWTGCSEADEPALTLDAVRESATCRANFERLSYRVTVQREGAGGEVAITSPAPACRGATCSKEVVGGSSVTIEATPAAEYVFAGWSGCSGAATGRTAMLTVEGDTTCTASFAPTFAVSGVALQDTRQGYVEMPDGSYTVTVRSSATAGCTAASCALPSGASVALEATAANGSGYRFDRWECTGTSYTGRTAMITLPAVAADTVCTALFLGPTTYRVNGDAYLDGVFQSGMGFIGASSTAEWAVCSGTGCTVLPNSVVTLTASTSGRSFRGWSCSNGQRYETASIRITASDANVNCEASFSSPSN